MHPCGSAWVFAPNQRPGSAWTTATGRRIVRLCQAGAAWAFTPFWCQCYGHASLGRPCGQGPLRMQKPNAQTQAAQASAHAHHITLVECHMEQVACDTVPRASTCGRALACACMGPAWPLHVRGVRARARRAPRTGHRASNATQPQPQLRPSGAISAAPLHPDACSSNMARRGTAAAAVLQAARAAPR